MTLLLKFHFIVLATLLVAGCTPDETPKAENGTLSLDNWDTENDGKIDLVGGWEFYWKTNHPEKILSKPSSIIQVPSAWNDHSQFPSTGYGLYHLHITNLEKGMDYGLRIPTLSSAYILWIDEKRMASNGTIGDTKQSEKPSNKPQEVYFTPNSPSIDLYVVISNHHYREGGMWESLTLGTKEQIRTYSNKKLILQAFLIGSLILSGLYHLVLYFHRRIEIKVLLFSMICLIISARISVIGEQLILDYLPALPWELMIKIEYITFYSVVPIFTWFIYYLYPNELSRKLCKYLSFIGSLFVAIVLTTSAIIYTETVFYYQILTLMTLLYLQIIIFKAAINKREGAVIVLVCSLFFAFTVINDILDANLVIQSIPLSGIGLFVFIFSQSYIIAKSFSSAFHSAEQYSNELTELNHQLEEKIQIRTQSLQESKQKLQQMNDYFKEMSYYDQLTNLPNRRYFDEVFATTWNETMKSKTMLSILYFDIDHFKKYNDSYGHQQGDQALQKVAKDLEHSIHGGTVARMGGEEFIALTTTSTLEEVKAIAEQARENIINLSIEHQTSPTLSFVTISVGVATITPKEDFNHRDLIHYADRALYQSKENGKNQVTIHFIE